MAISAVMATAMVMAPVKGIVIAMAVVMVMVTVMAMAAATATTTRQTGELRCLMS